MERRFKNYDVPRNIISTWLLTGNKGKNKSALRSGEVSTKRKKNGRVGQNENLEKALFGWFKRVWMNNLPICGTILKEKAISYPQELEVEKIYASNGWFEKWRMGNFFRIYKSVAK